MSQAAEDDGPCLNSQDNGDYYFNNASTGFTAPSGTYGGLAPSDLIRVVAGGTFTLNFTTPVVNPYVALVSVGQPSLAVTYSFPTGSSPSVVSSGPNLWGYTGYSVSGDAFTGNEFNGVLQLTGTYSSLTFTINPDENWHAFNIGVGAVPEPSTYLAGLGALGMLGMFGWRNRK